MHHKTSNQKHSKRKKLQVMENGNCLSLKYNTVPHITTYNPLSTRTSQLQGAKLQTSPRNQCLRRLYGHGLSEKRRSVTSLGAKCNGALHWSFFLGAFCRTSSKQSATLEPCELKLDGPSENPKAWERLWETLQAPEVLARFVLTMSEDSPMSIVYLLPHSSWHYLAEVMASSWSFWSTSLLSSLHIHGLCNYSQNATIAPESRAMV